MMPPVSLPLMPNTLQVWPFCAWAAGANNDRASAQASIRRIGVSVDIEPDIAAAAPRGSRLQEQHLAANRFRAGSAGSRRAVTPQQAALHKPHGYTDIPAAPPGTWENFMFRFRP